MDCVEFVNSLYLGDRGCESINIDCINSIVKFKIDTISRIRSESGEWEYYNLENIDGGCIVFSSVSLMKWNSRGLLPNDYISLLTVSKHNDEGLYNFIFEINATNECDSEQVHIELIAKNIYIEDRVGKIIIE